MAYTYAGRYGAQQIISAAGVPLPSKAVTVYQSGTQVKATLYTDRTKGTQTANPTSTDTLGNLTFFADPGTYDLAVAGIATVETVQVTFDVSEDQPGSFGSGTYLSRSQINNQTDVLPNEGWTGWTRPRAIAIGGKCYVSSTGSDDGGNAVYVTEYTSDGAGGLFRRRILLANVINGASGALMDDHTNPAILVQPGKPMVAIYSAHNIDNVLRWRKSTVPIEQGVSFGPEQRLELSTGDMTAYASAHIYANSSGQNTIYVWHRTGPNANAWTLTKSTDFGSTFGSPVAVFTAGVDQFYLSGMIVGDVMRCAASNHPSAGTDHNVYYAEINLITGSVTKSDGTVLGNLNGTNLPIARASMELVASPGTNEVLWDPVVGGAANPEIFWCCANLGSIPSTQRYQQAVRSGSTWSATHAIVNTGDPINGAAWSAIQVAGADNGAAAVQGECWLSRESSGVYYVEKWNTTNGGTSWTSTSLGTAPLPDRLTRVWPVDNVDGGTPLFNTVVMDVNSYPAYTNWVSTVRPLPLSQPVKRWRPVATINDLPVQVAPPGGLYLPGTTGNYVSTPQTGANTLTGAQRLECDVALDNWANGSTQQALLCRESSPTTRGLWLGVNTDGKPLLGWSVDGSASLSLTPSPPLGFANGQRVQLRVDFIPSFNGGTQYKIAFWYRIGGVTGQWVMHSSTQNPGATSVFAGTSPWEIGSRWVGATSNAKGIFYSAALRTIGGTLITGWRGDVPGTRYAGPDKAIWTVNGSGSAWSAPDTAI